MKGFKFKLSLICCFGMALFLKDAISQSNNQLELPEYDSELMAAEDELAAAEADLVEEIKVTGQKDNTNKIENKITTAQKPAAQQDKKTAIEEKFIVKEPAISKKLPIQTAQKQVTSATPAKIAVNTKPAQNKAALPNNPTGKSELELLKTKLALKEKAIVDLNSQLRKTKDRLMVAETEIDRLAVIVKTNNQDQLHSISPKAKLSSNISTNPALPERNIQNASTRQSSIVPDRKVSEDMPIVTVIVDKANLRTGPGDNNSPLMTIAKGTRLAVETRIGEWYRVITPTGSRAWISGEVVRFGKDLRSSPTRTVEVKGYSRQEIDEAFELIKQHSS